MKVTLDLPDEFAAETLPRAEVLAGIVEAGLRRRQLHSPLLRDLAVMIEGLAASPEPADVAATRVSEPAQERMEELLEKNREQALTADERREWEELERLDYLLRAAKVSAIARLASGR